MKNKKSSFKLLFSFLLGILFVGGVVYAATTVASSTVTYSNSKSGLSSTTVQGAIDELYTKTKSSASSINALPNIVAAYKYSTTTATKCTTGNESTCVVTYCYTSSTAGSCEPGTIIKYRVNDSEIRAFNVVSDNGSTITMQEIATNADTMWYYDISYGPVSLLNIISSYTKNWTNVKTLSYMMGVGSPRFTACQAYNECSSNSYTKTITGKARVITLQEATALGCTNIYGSCPEWVVSNPNKGTIHMIWTLNTVYDTTNQAWVISHYRYLDKKTTSENTAYKVVVDIDKPA